MKTVLWKHYGLPDLLEIGEVEKPVANKGEILIKVHAATVTAGDCEIRRFEIHPLFWIPLRLIFGIFKPRKKMLGQEFSGEIVGVGEGVDQFKIGDEVFGGTGIGFGTYCEFRVQKSALPIARKPEKLSHQEAATINTGGINGIHFLRKVNVKAGDKLLINGAGGSIGTYALQLAKLDGVEVTCVDSEGKLDMLTETGADHVIDYQKESFLDLDQKYDAIIDVVGGIPLLKTMKVLKPNGRLMLGNPQTAHMFVTFWISKLLQKKVVWSFAGDNNQDLKLMAKLMEEGKIKAVIDRTYSLEEVPEAHQYVESGLKKGNVVIQID